MKACLTMQQAANYAEQQHCWDAVHSPQCTHRPCLTAPSCLTSAGSLPANLTRAFASGQVFVLDISSNKLTGTLPEAWGSTAARFNTFNISSNNLNGSIPSSWANLMLNSSSFDASFLQLTGGLPGVLWGGVNTTLAAK